MSNILKLFSGAQLGAETYLEKDKLITIGNNFDNDIFLSIGTNINYLIKIKIINDITIEFVTIPKELKLISQDFKIMEEGNYELPIFLSINELDIGIGHKDDLIFWPENTSFDINPNNIVNSMQNSKLGKIKQFLTIKHYNLKALLISLSNYLNKKHKWGARIFYSIGAILFIIIILLITFSIKYQIKKSADNARTQLELNLKKAFYSIQIKDANIFINSINNQNIISGLMPTESSVSLLKHQLESYNKYITYEIYVTPNVIAQIKAEISKYNLNGLTVFYDTNEQAIIIAGMSSSTNQLVDIINNKFPNLTNIQFNVFSVEDIINSIQDTLDNLTDLVTININNANITLSGYLTPSQMQTYTTKLNQLEVQYKDTLTFQSNVKDIIQAFPSKIYAVYVGKSGHIILDNGNMIFVGGSIGEFTLIQINPTSIILEYKNNKFEITLDSINNTNQETVVTAGVDRKFILREEQSKLTSLIDKEKKQLIYLKTNKQPLNESSDINFVREQIQNLELDIQEKQKDLLLIESTITNE